MVEPRSRFRELATGLALGLLAGLIVKELDLTTVVSYHGDRSKVVLAAAIVGGVMGLTALRRLLAIGTSLLVALWLVVCWTPLASWMGESLPRRDPLERADAVFVLGSGLQPDGELSSEAMTRLVHGLELLGEGWASRLILTELPEPWPRYKDAACELMDRLGMSQEVIAIGPTRNTHDEAVMVAELARDWGFEKIIMVTAPSHTRRAAAVLEAQGVHVIASPSTQVLFDLENLSTVARGDDRTRAFGVFLHEYVGLWYYQMRGWLLPG